MFREITWDDKKEEWLKEHRSVSFIDISNMILDGKILDIIQNNSRNDQYCFIVKIRGYTWSVPFIYENEDRIVLKTAYPSRKLHREYGGLYEWKNGR